MISRASLLVAVAAFAIAIFYAAVADSYAVFLIATISLTAIACIGLNVLLGLAGQISLGHIGFMAIGAYTTVLLMEKADLIDLFQVNQLAPRGNDKATTPEQRNELRTARLLLLTEVRAISEEIQRVRKLTYRG